jgi:endo-1,4-beta-xylanase
MKIQSIFLTFLIIICLTTAACGSGQFQTPTIVPSPTFTPTPIPTPTFTSTPRTPTLLSQTAALYNGPDNVNYESLASLSAGTTVYPLGTYGDFVQVAVVEAGNEVEGFVWKNALQSLSIQLPVLKSNQVPWEPFYLPACLTGEYNQQANSLTFTNTSENYYDLESEALAMEEPIRIRIDKLDAGIIKILGIPERGDPWWKGITRMSIYETADGNYMLGILDGLSESYAASIELSQRASKPIQIVFDSPQGKSFTVLDENNHMLKTMNLTTMAGLNLPNGFFPNKEMYFGISVAPHSSLVVTGMTIETLPKGQWTDPDPGPGLIRQAEDRNLTIGTEFRLDQMNYQYCKTMQLNFNVAVLSEFNFPGFWLDRGKYDSNTLDQAVNFADQHGWRVRASHLVYGEKWFLPDWIKNTNYPPETYKEILKEHIHTVMDHFRGRIQEWSLANELAERVLCPPGKYGGQYTPDGDFWFEKIYGISQDYNQNYDNYIDYIKTVFGWARAEDPTATLILNDSYNNPPYNACINLTIQSMHDAVEALNGPGQPKLIDVIGMEMHLGGAPTKEDLLNTMQILSASGTGVRIYITEMDVNLSGLIASHPGRDERWEIQAAIYKDVVDACLESGVCDNFSTWGIRDADSWMTVSCNTGCLNQPDADPLMFDDNFLPKPAYYALRDALAGTSPSATTGP